MFYEKFWDWEDLPQFVLNSSKIPYFLWTHPESIHIIIYQSIEIWISLSTTGWLKIVHFFFLINYQIFLCFCIFGNITFLFLQWTQLIFTPNGQLLVHRIQNHWKWKKWVLKEQLHLCPYFWNTWYTFTRAGKESQVRPKLWEWFLAVTWQLNRWPCHWLTDWLTEWATFFWH